MNAGVSSEKERLKSLNHSVTPSLDTPSGAGLGASQFDLCKWLVEGEDIEGVHELLVRHHRLLTNRALLRP